jgi:8-oxo-dGTP diphosphatase
MPMIGVGGVVIRDGRALLIRRGSEPLKGEWSIPGGMLEVGETIAEGVARELLEETGLSVRVLDLIEVFERIFHESEVNPPPAAKVQPKSHGIAGSEPLDKRDMPQRPLYHFVILDYLCAAQEGNPKAGGDVTDVAFAAEDELAKFSLSPTATRVIRKAFALARQSAK